MDQIQASYQSHRRHSNAAGVYGTESTSSDTLETINETSGRTRTRSFSRGIKDLFHVNRRKSTAGSVNNNYNVPTVAVHNPVVSLASDGKPSTGNGTTTLPYWANQPRKSVPVSKEPRIQGRPRSNSEAGQPSYHKLNVPSPNGGPSAYTSTASGDGADVETSTPMSHLLLANTGGDRGPPTTQPRVGPTEFLELYKSLTFGSASLTGDSKLAANRNKRFESPVGYPGRRRTSIAVTPQSGFLHGATTWETVDEQQAESNVDRQRPLRALSKSPCSPTNTSPTHSAAKTSLLTAAAYRRPRRNSAPAVDVGHLPSRFGGGMEHDIQEDRVAEAMSNFPKFTANTPAGLTSADTSDTQPQKHVIIWRDRLNGTRVFTLPGPGDGVDHDVDHYGNNEKMFITKFMKKHQCYELMPNSSKLILFDINLEVICAFYAMLYNGIKAAPIWDGTRHKFVGMMTVTDFIRILQRCYQQRGNFDDIEKHKISDWRGLLDDGLMPEIAYVDPNDSLCDAITMLRQEKVHRLLVVDHVDGNALCILSYKRILRFLYQSANCLPRPDFMSQSIGELDIGTYHDIVTVKLKTRLIETLNLLIERRISAVPVVNEFGQLINIYTKFDTINLARDQLYTTLDCSMDAALSVQRDDFALIMASVVVLLKHETSILYQRHNFELIDFNLAGVNTFGRSPILTNLSFEGLYTCKKTDSLEKVIHWFVKAEIHRMVIVDDAGHVQGVVSLSDLIHHLVQLSGDDTDGGSDSSDEFIIEQF